MLLFENHIMAQPQVQSLYSHNFGTYHQLSVIKSIHIYTISIRLSYRLKVESRLQSDPCTTQNSKIRLLLLLLANHVDHDHPKDGGDW